MQTKYWNLQGKENPAQALQEAGEFIKKGELIGFPTETVYGLGADGLNPEAVAKIYQAKGRPSDNPLILHIAERKMLDELVSEVTPLAEKVIEKFWPGPLTIILPKSKLVPEIITAGLETVAIRMPDHQLARDLILEAKRPIAAPSANLSGKPSPTTAEHVYHDLNGKIAGIIDSGPTGIGVESTVLDCSQKRAIILRPGGITKEDLEEVLGEVLLDPALHNKNEVPKAPGMKYKHYSPDAELILFQGNLEEQAEKIISALEKYERENKKIGLMLSQEMYNRIRNFLTSEMEIESLGSKENLAEITANIFAVLRKLDAEKVDIILGETYPEEGIGLALMNRLRKSSAGKIF